MSASNKVLDSSGSRAFSPFLTASDHQRLQTVIDFTGKPLPGFAEELRSLARRFVDDGDDLKLRAICLLLADLFEQGWSVGTSNDAGFRFQPPGLYRDGTETVDDVKARIRQTMQVARIRQLAEPSVRSFLERTEKHRIRNGIKGSVVDLIDDGAALAREFSTINDLPAEEQEKALAALIKPVIEVCEAGRHCPDTGLPLIDIWRYFRHTWAHEYRSIPGRQMLILIRNAARPNRPVMGIAMLASPVMRLTARDKWIGWLPESAKELIERGYWSANEFADALWSRVQASISEIRWDDLATNGEICSPSEAVVFRLEQHAAGAAAAREAQLKVHFESEREQGQDIRPHRGSVGSSTDGADWLEASKDLLFVRKRAEGLAKLLFAKHMFQVMKLTQTPAEALKALFETRDGKRALDTVLAEFRKAGLSSEVADVSICGAVPPYNELLSGKLVALLLASQDVRDAYAKRYGGQISIIASQMAGRPIVKSADLKLITTTSLYGVGSSQYNRLILRAAEHEDLHHDMRWDTIGKSLTGGFGTLHLGQETAQALRAMAFKRHEARRVNNRFGEGTSPRLRQIREGLDALGIKSDAILNHATPRIFYGCELVDGARDALLGFNNGGGAAPSAAVIAAAWRRRWLVKRVQREETRAKLERLGPISVRASLHADENGQYQLPMDAD